MALAFVVGFLVLRGIAVAVGDAGGGQVGVVALMEFSEGDDAIEMQRRKRLERAVSLIRGGQLQEFGDPLCGRQLGWRMSSTAAKYD